MAIRKITEKTVSQAFGEDAHLLVTQTETEDGSEVTVLRRVPVKNVIETQEDINQALLVVLQKVAYISDDAMDAYQALYDLIYPPSPPAVLTSISAVFDASHTVYEWDSLNSIKNHLTVTALYDNGDTEVVTDYTLSGSMATGNNTFTVTYGGKTATFTIPVYGFAFVKGYLNGKPSGGTKVQIKSNTKRILADSLGGITPYKYEDSTPSIYFGIPIGNNGRIVFSEAMKGYRAVYSINEWDDELNDYAEISNSGWSNIGDVATTTGNTINSDYRDHGYFIAVSVSGSTGSEEMGDVDTTGWSITLRPYS